MCFASAESDSWSDFQGVHVCSLVLSHMLQWKWDFFQNSSQHFKRSFHFFPCAREGAIQRSLWTQSQCQSVEVTYGAVTRWCHTFFCFCSSSMQIISCSCSRITCLNSEVCFLSFPLVVVFFFFFCKGCVSIWIWGWSPCVHMLMLPPHLPGLVCIFCFRFSGERESFLPPPEVSPSVEETQAKWAEKSLTRNQSQILLNKLWLIWSDWFYFDREQVLRITTQSPMNSEGPLAVLRWYWPSDASLNANGSESLWRIKTAKIKSRWINRGINRFENVTVNTWNVNK